MLWSVKNLPYVFKWENFYEINILASSRKKLIIKFSDKFELKPEPECMATETGLSLEILIVKSVDIM